MAENDIPIPEEAVHQDAKRDAESKHVLEIRGLRTEFAGNVVHTRIDLEIIEGESFVVMGPSGGGKSVLLKEIIGLLKPTRGEILFDGEDLVEKSESEMVQVRRQISMLFQGGALFDSLNVFDNIAYPLREQNLVEENELQEIVLEKLEMVGLPGIETRMPAELSGGMRKRVALARSIATNPRVVLYDEPTTGLDPTNIRRINELIRKLQHEVGITSIIVTHELPTVFEAADRGCLLWNGEVVAVGSPKWMRHEGPEIARRFIEGTAPL